MIETIVDSIRVNLVTQSRVVFLKEIHGDRHLPIWIGEFEAHAIAMELQGMASPRPLPYDLLRTVITDMDGRIERVVVTELSQEVFFARIIIDAGGRVIEVDARPSDAIALAVRARCPILVEDMVMERAGVSIDPEDDADVDGASEDIVETQAGAAVDDDRLSVFREFIDTLDLDDFEKRRGN